MKKNLVKFGVGAGAALTTLYWGVLPALADTVGLCPTQAPFPPGCDNGKATAISVGSIISSVLNLLLFVAFVAALIFLIIGGIKWILSGGDKEGTSKAKETVTSALIGLAVVLAAWILINILLSFFGVSSGLTGLTVPTLNVGTGTTH
ncbi:pilin [Patescibacteria group bacterium]|nr:pilin [Patescibacteria group bacterium]